MNDFIGQELLVGDTVVFSDSTYETSALKKGTITGFSNKKVRISSDDFAKEVKKFEYQIAKIEDGS